MTPAEWASVAAVVGALFIGLPLIRIITARAGSPPEVSRKSVHVAMGLICIAFPWIFERSLPVWILAAIATLPLALIRSIPAMRRGLGSAIHGIKRPSYGEVLFAPAVAAVFQISGGDPFLHGIPIGILTLADAGSALGGTRWGRRHFGCGDGFKTIEGSAIFFAIAYLCVFLPLYLGRAEDGTHAFWIALILATLAMMAEGLSDRGFDNLVIPLGCVLVLERLLPLEMPDLVGRFAILSLLLVLVLTGSRWSTLNGGALLGSALLGYGCAILADWRYALPPSAVFVCHVFTTRKYKLTKSFDHRLDAVLSHAIAGLPWVVGFAAGHLSFSTGLAGISFAMIAQLAILDTATRRSLPGVQPRPFRATLKGLLIAGLPGLLWLLPHGRLLAPPLWLGLVAVLVAVLVFDRIQLRYRAHPTGLWMIKGGLALLASTTALLFHP